MNWHKEGIGAAIAEAKSKGEIFAVFVKSKLWNLLSHIWSFLVVLPSGLTQLYTTGPPEAAQEETQSLEAALSDEEVGLIYNVAVIPSLSDGLFQFCLNPLLSGFVPAQ